MKRRQQAPKPLRGSLDGPSRTIIVEPVAEPEPEREIELEPVPPGKPEKVPVPPAKPAR
jgi:hypothetical protein